MMLKYCKKCKIGVPISEENCLQCGEVLPPVNYAESAIERMIQLAYEEDSEEGGNEVSQKITDNRKIKSKKQPKSRSYWASADGYEIRANAPNVILTTSSILPGNQEYEIIEVISAECVYGMNIFRDFFAGVRDIFGGRSAATQTVLRDARRTALTELRREALMVGADAVIGIDLDYQELSGGGKNGMLMLVASGTAISLKLNGESDENT